jgi:5-amino-6-(5-phosphoribosylamino)uracil reductase
VRRLWPAPPDVDVDVGAVYGSAHRPRPAHRPWVTVLMIASADGAVAIDGRSGGLGGEGDRAVYRAVRATADAVLVGAATVRAEVYRPMEAPRRLLVVTAGGDLGASSAALLAAPTTTLVMPEGAETPSGLPAGGATVLRAGAGRVDPVGALRSLVDVAHVVCEGGPSLNGQLLAAGAVDEVCLSLAPRFVAGEAARLAHGPVGASDVPWVLAHVLVDGDGFLFLRYVRGGASAVPAGTGS